MGKLGDVTTKRIELPSGDWVDVKTELLLGDIVAIQSVDDDEQRGVKGFSIFIKDWSFTEDGTPDSEKVPVTDETVQQLKASEVQIIGDQLKAAIDQSKSGLEDEEKKSLSSPLTAVTENQPPII